MGYIKTRGIIIREHNSGEADKFLVIFSQNYGKMNVSARNSRRPRSGLVGSVQCFSYNDFVLYKSTDSYSISSCEVLEPFFELRNDIDKLTYAAYFSDIIMEVVQENQPSPRVLKLFLNTLYLLSKNVVKPELLSRIFELRILSIIGYAPAVTNCISCGKSESLEYFFSFEKCGVICGECMTSETYARKLSSGAYKAINYIIHSPLNKLFNFNISDKVLNELEYISRRYLTERLEKNFNRLDYLKNLNEGLRGADRG